MNEDTDSTKRSGSNEGDPVGPTAVGDAIGDSSTSVTDHDDGVEVASSSSGLGIDGSHKGALIRLALVVAAVVAIAVATDVIKTVLVVFAVIAMVMIHELGHFATAKWAGMKVTEYFLGFGPRLWSIRRGETEYGIKALPLGGYVKIIGMSNLEEVDPSEEHRTYRQKPYWRRLSVAVAGSFTHFVMAYLILVFLQAGMGVPKAVNEIGGLARGVNGPTPAEQAGLQVGDKIIAVDGKVVDDWTSDVPAYLSERAGVPVSMTIERGGAELDVSVTPMDSRLLLPPAQSETAAPIAGPAVGKIGITPVIRNERVDPLTAVGRSFTQMFTVGWEVIKQIGDIFSPSGIENYFHLLTESSDDASDQLPVDPASEAETQNRFLSPLGFVDVAHGAASAGLREVLVLLFSFNLFIGIFNLMPLLPFDGGHVAVATYEKLRSSRGRRHMVDFAKLLPVSYAVFIIIVFIGLSSLWLDVFNPIQNPFE